jgi:hypothetical protein
MNFQHDIKWYCVPSTISRTAVTLKFILYYMIISTASLLKSLRTIPYQIFKYMWLIYIGIPYGEKNPCKFSYHATHTNTPRRVTSRVVAPGARAPFITNACHWAANHGDNVSSRLLGVYNNLWKNNET